ncbi:MAG: hypothetical protein IKM83_00720 [Paludibacteraceae bacterium]|nr:hypothetical protein [Paludibacteraceae bacterium]
MVGSQKRSTFAPFFDDACSQGKSKRPDAHALARTKNGISLLKERNKIMKRFLMTMTTVVVLLTGVIVADAAKCSDNFTVRFRENTLVVCATQLEEARIYSMDGKLLRKERGQYVEFELEPGTYRLFAKVGDTMERRRIELR